MRGRPFGLPYYDYSGGTVQEEIAVPGTMAGPYTGLGFAEVDSTPWWEKILDAGTQIVTDIWGNKVPTYTRTTAPVYSTASGGLGVSTGVLVMGAAVILLLLTRKGKR